MTYLLDTDTCSHIMRSRTGALWDKLDELPEQSAAMSVITLGELQFGAALKPLATRIAVQLEKLLRCMPVLSLTPEVCTHYARIRADLQRKGTPIGPNDLWIAAHAVANQLTLVTHNTREFARVGGLKLESWVNQ
jgi:tRNA(fMet)-specific endonuclease VapC